MRRFHTTSRRPAIATLALCLTLSLTALPTGARGQSQEAQEEPPPAPSLTDEEMESLAKAYLDVTSIHQEAQGRIAAASSPEEAQQIQSEINQEFIQLLESHGWSPEEYNDAMEAVQNHDGFRERLISVLERIQKELNEGDGG